MRRLLLLFALMAAFALAAACTNDGGDGDATPTVDVTSLTPVAGNSEVVIGPNRFSVGLISEDGEAFIPAEGDTVSLRFFFGESLIFQEDTHFVYAIPGETGFFVASVDFPVTGAGDWRAEPVITTGGQTTTLETLAFTVLRESQVPNIGGQAIAVENLTFASEPNHKKVTTDPDPDPAFYEKTVAQALQEGRPMVVVFATPAFCQTAFCGPILDNVKAVQPGFADTVDFIHIEPYELDGDGNLITGDGNLPIAAAPTQAWGLQTEPWVYVVNAEGRITARFEGAAAPEELSEAIQATLA
jgi:hypothetical protein